MTRDEAQARVDRAFQALAASARGAVGDGTEEGGQLQEAYDALVAAAAAGVERLPYAASYLFMRLCAHDWLARLDRLGEVDRQRAEEGAQGGPHMQVQLARLGPGIEERLALLDQRRAWGRAIEAAAGPPMAPAPRRGGGKIRLGLISSDLRQTNVGVFAWPLFEHKDAERFELYVYSPFPGAEDPIQALFRGWSDGYRQRPGASPREMAELVAADGLDMLVELGEPYAWAVCAHRPARLQASWMGYSNSVGLSTIDHIILDPFLAPEDPRLVTERPLLMPDCWLAMSEAYFEPEPALPETVAQDRNGGLVTFGTLNAPYKFTPAVLDLWGRILAAVPNSRFVVVRPEAAARTFRENLCKAFAVHGVGAERVGFAAVRGRHLPWYNEIDIALDPFPVTGGTTTCETLWMGVPLVTLVGAAPFERMSWSLLANAGLEDLAARTPEAYLRVAVALAGDPARRRELKRTLRERIRSRPLGQSRRFAQDFYDLIARAVESR